MLALLVLGEASQAQASPVLFARHPWCEQNPVCGPETAIPGGSLGPNAYFPNGVLATFKVSQTSLIDEIDFWAGGPLPADFTFTFAIRAVSDVGASPPLNLNVPTFTATGVDVTSEFFGYDRNCGNPGCAYYKFAAPLSSLFEAQANVSYYLQLNAFWLVDAGNPPLDVGPYAGQPWIIAGACLPGSMQQPPCVAAGGVAFEVHGVAAPEPASILLLGTGLLALVVVVRRRQSSGRPRRMGSSD